MFYFTELFLLVDDAIKHEHGRDTTGLQAFDECECSLLELHMLTTSMMPHFLCRIDGTLSRPYTRQLLSPATRQHYRSCVLRMKYRMLHSTSCLRIDSPSIFKQLVECIYTMRYFHAQHAQTIMLPYRLRQKLPRVWSALHCSHPAQEYLSPSYAPSF